MTCDGCEGAVSEGSMQDLVVVTSASLDGELDFPPSEKRGFLPSRLDASPGRVALMTRRIKSCGLCDGGDLCRTWW